MLRRRFLISRGADKNALTDEGERPIDLVDPEDKVTPIDLVDPEDKVTPIDLVDPEDKITPIDRAGG